MNPNGQPQPTAAPDPTTNAQILANAIRLNEGGDDYSAKGDSGTSWGAYQFGQGAWDNASKLAGLTSKWGEADAADQNAAADAQIKAWLAQGKTPPQIASMWNAGAGAPDAYTGTFPDGSPSVGYNAKIGRHFDVPSYVKNVLNTASRLYDGQTSTGDVTQARNAVAGQLRQSVDTVKGAIGTPATVGLGGALAGLAGGTIAAAAPEISAVGGALAAARDFGGSILDATGISSLFKGNTTNNIIQPSQTATALQDALSQTIGGNAVMQEAQNRGVDLAGTMEQSGAIPQPDANGNFDKVTPITTLQNQVGQDKKFQSQALTQMNEQTSLHEMEALALAEAEKKMQGSPELSSTKARIGKIFANYREQQPKEKDKYGNEYTKSFHVSPARLQLMQDRVSEGENWATPSHERSANQHVYKAMGARLSAVAKKHNIKGWDETKKRMESRLLAIKAIKKMPKKAQRNRAKELRHDIAAGLGGALIGKTLGQGILGSTAGYLMHRQLGHKHYKGLGTKKEREEHQKRSKEKQKSLIHTNETPK